MPTSWIKFGEVFYNQIGEPKFVCSICLEKADPTTSAHTTSEVSVFLWHIQKHHISTAFGTIQNNSTETQNLNDNNKKQNPLELLEEFHETLVKSNAVKNSDYIFHNLDVNEESQHENNNYNFSNCNYYCNEDKTCTISDDEKDNNNQELQASDGEFTVTNYLKHNDMIEISDEEESDEDEIEENPFRLLGEKSNLNDGVDSVGKNKCITSNNIEESMLSETNSVINIPTPAVSPCESLTNSHYSALNNASMGSSDEVHNSTKYSAKPFRAIQCKICGIRTINEINMRIHLQRFHKPVLDNNQLCRLYHQVSQSRPNKQQDLNRNDSNQREPKPPFKCKYCRIRTKTTESMERHQRLYHSPDSHLLIRQCEICRRHILTKKLLQHMDSHLKAGLNSEYLRLAYNQNYALNSHISNYNAVSNLQSQEFAINLNVPLMSYQAN